MAILTDRNGKPFAKPDAPPKGAPIEDIITYLRASNAYNDTVASSAHRSFDKAFRKAMRR